MASRPLAIENESANDAKDPSASGEFLSQEPGSFGSRITPILTPIKEVKGDVSEPTKAEQAFDEVDQSFWESSARQSVVSALPFELQAAAPRAPRSKLRSFASKLLFATLLLGTMSLLAYEIKVALGSKPPAIKLLPGANRG